MFKDKNVLVAGGTSLVGIPLVELLIEQGAKVKIASLDDHSRAHKEAEFVRVDLTDHKNCFKVCEGVDYVFNLMCVKGSPEAMRNYPAKFFDALSLLGTILPRAAFKAGVSGYLFASSVADYQPAEVLFEDDVWKTNPSKNDWFAGHAKRMGELQVEAYRKQYNWTNTAIVRPSNVYGPFDNFEPNSALFMANKIRQFAERENPIVVWGDGSQIRDFIYSKDAARGILLVAEKAAGPINLCSGRPTTVKEVVETLAAISSYNPKIIYDTGKPSGDAKRLLDVTRLKALGFEPQISLEEGIMETIEWYRSRKNKTE